MEHFIDMLATERSSLERFVRYRLNSKNDADDVLQEIYLTAYQKFSQLKKEESFKPWILSIARNKCNDYFRKKANQLEIPIEALAEKELYDSRYGITEVETVRETLDLLGDKDKQILYLYFWKGLPQTEIARQLHIPLGTVKSRLYTAKQNFKNKYPGEKTTMKKLPEFLPQYKIQKSNDAPFAVKWEELMGWFIIPRLGESISCGMYDIPSRKCSHIYDMKVIGKAVIHGIEGVELTASEASYSDKKEMIHRTFVAQLTDTHCRYLAAVRNEDNVRNYITFLDGDAFMQIWGFGEDNCGNETNLVPKGDIKRNGQMITSRNKNYLLDIVGRYTVTINDRCFDTVCVMVIETLHSGVVSEQFIDQNGRTILWRRYNRNDWAIDHYHKEWTELLPENERLTINGVTYVHWYDCITDYILSADVGKRLQIV